jgi:hypothetical protein
VNIRRRGFLLSVGAGALGSATAAVASVPPVAAAASAPAPESERGYQETEHVRRYYRTTMI